MDMSIHKKRRNGKEKKVQMKKIVRMREKNEILDRKKNRKMTEIPKDMRLRYKSMKLKKKKNHYMNKSIIH